MEERAVTTRLIRLTLSAIVLAQPAQAQSVAKPALATQTQQREVETGSWRSGDAIIWIRVAPTGSIGVYASHGYRSAFARAVYITPEDAERWADMGDRVVAGQPAPGVILADSDLALEPARQGDSTVLTVRLGGVRPEGITFFMTSAAIRDISPMLRQTARAARANMATNASPSAAASPPAAAPAAATPAAVAPTAAAPPAAAPTTAAPTAAAPASVAPPASHAAPNATAAIVAPPEVAAPGTADVAATAVPATPATPVATVATTATSAPAAPISVVPVSTTTTPTVATNTATCAPSKTATPAKIALVKTTTVPLTKAKPATPVAASSEMRRTSTGSIAKPAAATPTRDDVTDATKLSASTVANLVKQWESQLDLCYSEYGLKVNPALTGSIAVRLAIRSSGEVAAATFTRHKWSGAGGTEAESCMRARVMAWMFPPASTPSAHEFTVAFAP
jgi:hypothetical protein